MSKKILFYSIVLSLFALQLAAQGTPEYNKWVTRGFELYNTGQFKESAQAYSKAFASINGKAVTEDRYNAACSWSLAGAKDSAFFHLSYLAVKANFTDYAGLLGDKDFTPLHADKRWLKVCEQVKQNKEKAAALLDKSLVAILDTVSKNDQQYRSRLASVETKYGKDSKELQELWKTISLYDSLNLIIVSAIIEKHGWPGPDVVGEEGSATVFLVVQHADIKTQDKYLPLMRDAVKKGKAEAASLAMLEDRVALRHQKKQVYGSQVTSDATGNFLAPMIDPDNVDKRRASVGLGPLAEYLENFGMTWNVAAYKKQLPELEKRQKSAW